MGLDGVKLVIKIERVFDVQIADEEGTEIKTVGELHELLVRKKETVMSSANARLFDCTLELIRNAVSEELKTDMNAICADTKISSIVPPQRRRQVWQRLGESMHLDLPSLERPGWLVFLTSILVFIVSLIVLITVADVSIVGGIAAGSASVLVGGALAAFVTAPFKTRIPRGAERFEDLAQQVMRRNFARLNTTFDSWTSEGILEMVRMILSDASGLPMEKIRPESRIIADLRLD